MSTRLFVRLGFVAVFLLLVASLYESYRILGDKLNDAGQEQFAQQEKMLGKIRDAVERGGNFARDFLLNPRPDRVARYTAQIGKIEADSKESLDLLEKNANTREQAIQLRVRMDTWFAVLRKIENWNEPTRFAQGYDFIREELPGPRDAAREILVEMTEANNAAAKRVAEELTWNRQAAMRRIFFLPAVCMVIAVAVVGFSFAYARDLEVESQRKYEEVARAKNEMERLSAHLLNVQEEERRGLSRELHDGIGQTLTALRIEVSHFQSNKLLMDEDVRERWNRAKRLAEDAVRTVRDISLLLRPSLLDDLGLEPALRWQTEDFGRRTGISCHFNAESLQEHIPDAWKTCVFRIVQEAIHNCEKHAAPTTVRVNIRQDEEQLIVDVEDDGCGFDLRGKSVPQGTGLGIVGMRERAAMLGGSLHIQSSPGRGTKLTVYLPLTRSISVPEPMIERLEIGA